MHMVHRKRSKLGNTYYIVVDTETGRLVDFAIKKIDAITISNRLDGDEPPSQPEESS
jgi:hypothetical protein